MRPIQSNLLPDELALNRQATNPDPNEPLSYTEEEIQAGGWSVDGPATFTAVLSPFYSADRFSLAVQNSQSGNQIVRTDAFTIEFPHVEDELIFHCLVFCESPLEITAHLHDADKAYTTETGYTNTNTVGVWSPVFSNAKTFGTSATFSKDLKITLVTSNTRVFYISMTALTNNAPHLDNQFSQLSKVYFPDIYRDVDDVSVAPTRPMDKLYHSLTANMSKVMDTFLEVATVGQADTDSTRQIVGSPVSDFSESRMTNPNLMPEELIPWAAQFVGTNLRDSVVVGGVDVVDSTVDFERWQLITKAYGQAAGSRQALKESAKLVLSDTKSVLVSPLNDGNRFEIMVRTLVSETPGNPVEGTSSPAVLAVLQDAKPAGYTVLHETLDEFGFVLNDSQFGAFNQGVLT